MLKAGERGGEMSYIILHFQKVLLDILPFSNIEQQNTKSYGGGMT